MKQWFAKAVISHWLGTDDMNQIAGVLTKYRPTMRLQNRHVVELKGSTQNFTNSIKQCGEIQKWDDSHLKTTLLSPLYLQCLLIQFSTGQVNQWTWQNHHALPCALHQHWPVN